MGRGTAGNHAKHEAEGHNAHVDNGVMLQLDAISEVEEPIEDDHAHRG